jgi:2-polyprenyl-3-methyl-5-hydroxy-6-metoxy-1,4-benzoquinol methylase
MVKTAVVILKGRGFRGIEGQAQQRIRERLLSTGSEKDMNIFNIDAPLPIRAADLPEGYDAYVVVSDDVFITLRSIKALSGMAVKNKNYTAVAPLSNETGFPLQKHSPPFIYQTLTVFEWAVTETYEQFKETIAGADDIDDFCFAVRGEIIRGLTGPSALPVSLKGGGLKFGIAKGVYVHRYGNNYESPREDLLAHVPLDVRDVLDIGSASGLFAEALKGRLRCRVTGVDSDSALIESSRSRLDRAIHGDIEKIAGTGVLEQYDCIVCGDVLEHLNDPWGTVKRLKMHLREGGLFVASSPNIANWAVLYEMLRGRWDYVPFTMLSAAHLRFFTRQTFAELFLEAGYKIKEIQLQGFALPEAGAGIIASLKGSFPFLDEEEMKASEIVIVASS